MFSNVALPPTALAELRTTKYQALFPYHGTPRHTLSRGPPESLMKVRNSLKSLKKRHKDCQIVRRRGRVYVINKTNPRFKARQGSAKKR